MIEEAFDAKGARREALADAGCEVCGMMQGKRSSKDRRTRAGRALAASLITVAVILPGLAQAEVIKNPIAEFAALDKVTGRISHLEIPIGKTVQFGALKVTPRVCDSRPPTEPPDTASFVEVDEVKLNGDEQRIFTGWMFAESPGLHAVEHPVFDVWLTNCKTPEGSKPAESAANAPEAAAPPAAAAPEPKPAPAPAPAAAAPRPKPAPPPAAAAEPTLPWLTPNAPSKRH
jgi:hypothetical protein